MGSTSAQLSIWVSGLDTPVVPRDVAGFFDRVGELHDVITAPDCSDSALVVFKDVRSVQKALLLDGTNMRDNVISVCVPSQSQLLLLSDRDQDLGDSSKALGLDRLKGWFEQLDPSDMIPLLQELTQVAQTKQQTPQKHHKFPMHVNSPIKPLPATPGRGIVNHPPSGIGPVTPSSGIVHNSPPGMVPIQQFPKLAFFSGDEAKAGEVKFWHWKSEVTSLLTQGYSRCV